MDAINSPVIRMLVSQLAQITVLIGLVLILLRLVGRRRPHLAHVVCLVVLVKCLTPPVWSSPAGVFCRLQSWVGSTFGSPEETTGSPGGELELPPMEEVVAAPIEYAPAADAETRFADTEPDSPTFADTGFVEPLAIADVPANEPVLEAESAAAFDARPWMIGWAAVAGLIGVFGLIRLTIVLRRIRRDGVDVPEDLQAGLDALHRRLNLRRRVRLLVTARRVGPAVVGLFRPVLILPEVIVKGRSAEELEPILAHELLHVRRGDLFVSLLQMAAEIVWWFYPLVRMLNKRLSREAERCCDDEVLAELGYAPARYARCLLEVLERKTQLQTVPAFPGVKPIELTKQRMERIMNARQGRLKRTPWWCWVVMVVAGLFVLPGGAETRAEDEAAPSPVAVVGDLGIDFHVAREDSTADGDAVKVSVRAYDVASLLVQLQTDYGLDLEAARKTLVSLLPDPIHEVPLGIGPKFKWSGGKLKVTHTKAGHKQVAAMIDVLRRHGFYQVVVETVMFSGPREEIEKLSSRWDAAPPEMANPASLRFGEPLSESDIEIPGILARGPVAESPEEPAKPRVKSGARVSTLFSLLDESKETEIREAFQSSPSINVLCSPKIAVFQGRSANVAINQVQRPFVVAIQDNKPQIRVVAEGLALRMRPMVQQDQSVELDCEVMLEEVLKIESHTFRTSPDDDPLTLKIPAIRKSRLNAAVRIPKDKLLLIGGLEKTDKQGHKQELLLLLKAKAIPMQLGNAIGRATTESDQKPDETNLRTYPSPVLKDRVDTVQFRLVEPRKARVRLIRGKDENWQLQVPFRKNLIPGTAYTFLMDQVPGRVDKTDWPVPYRLTRSYGLFLDMPGSTGTGASRYYLAQNSIPISVTDEDLDQADANNTVTKVYFLAKADKGKPVGRSIETIVSTRLDPGIDPLDEAAKRGQLLAVLKIQRATDGKVFGTRINPRVRDAEASAQPHPPMPMARAAHSEPSQAKLDGQLLARSYTVADLVVTEPGNGNDVGVPVPLMPRVFRNVGKRPSPNLEPLIELIEKTVQPDSWDEEAGRQIVPYEANLSLVVRQTRAVHEEIAEFLAKLRRQQGMQVATQCLLFTIADEKSDAFLDYLKLHPDDEGRIASAVKAESVTAALHSASESTKRSGSGKVVQILSRPQIRSVDEVVAALHVNGAIPAGKSEPNLEDMSFEILPTIAPDRRSVNLRLAAYQKKKPAAVQPYQLKIPDGTSVLVEVTDDVLSDDDTVGVRAVREALLELKKKEFGRRVFLLLTPQIIVEEEEEELLGVPREDGDK